MEEKADLVFSPSPHIRDVTDVPWIMRQVVIALIPAAVWGMYIFGFWSGFLPLLWSILSCLAFEYLDCKIFRRPISLRDGSALVTGLLLGLSLPPGAPFWLAVAGGGTAIILGKQIFGGLGQNIFNPALVARAVLLISWPRVMYTWVARARFALPDIEAGLAELPQGVELVTTATPLGLWEMHGLTAMQEVEPAILWRLFTGQVPGSIGEVSALLLIAGFVYLLWRGVVGWDIPLFFALGLSAVALAGGENPLFHLLAGSAVIGACFMATDYVTSPMSRKAKVIFGLGAGALTAVIRILGAYPEGVTFAILTMNAIVPLLDKLIPARFGVKRI